MDIDMLDSEFSSSFTTPDSSSDVSPSTKFCSSFFDDLQFVNSLEQYSPQMEDLDSFQNDQFLSTELEDVYRYLEGSENYFALQKSSVGSKNAFSLNQHTSDDEIDRSLDSSYKYSEMSADFSSITQTVLIFPNEEIEMDNQLSTLHLLKAYGDAKETGVADLAEVILKRIREKCSPIGTTVERLAYYLFQTIDRQDDYLKQESFKNYEAAFKAFYQILPYGKFAHLTANMSILEAIPDDKEIIHIIDFEIGDGVQWPPVIEAIARSHLHTLKLTSIKWEGSLASVPHIRFEETKRRLQSYADSCGVKLEVEEMEMAELVSEIRKTKRLGGREWLAFNCMSGLPHMGSAIRSHKQVTEFLKTAKDLVNSTNGTITLGDGSGGEERLRTMLGFGSFFNWFLLHSHALLESIEMQVPSHLMEARTTMECLFIASQMSCEACFRSWEDSKVGSSLESVLGFEGLRFSTENLLQAYEMVRGSQFGVEVESEYIAILKWRGTSLVRVSTWR